MIIVHMLMLTVLGSNDVALWPHVWGPFKLFGAPRAAKSRTSRTATLCLEDVQSVPRITTFWKRCKARATIVF